MVGVKLPDCGKDAVVGVGVLVGFGVGLFDAIGVAVGVAELVGLGVDVLAGVDGKINS